MKKINKLNKVLTQSVALTAAISVSATNVASAETIYRDLNQVSDWAAEAVTIMQKEGIMIGDTAGNFRPLDKITRQEVAIVLTRTLKLQVEDVTTSSFADVNDNDSALKYIEAVKKAGLMLGDGNDNFRPKDFMTREEMAATFVRIHNVDPTGKAQSLNVQDKEAISDWAKDYVAATLELGLMKGDGANFNPKREATRQETAMVANNNIQIIKKKAAGSDPVIAL